ncbi:MAG: glutamine synthetase III, partial [Silvanigrellaceae bacterium]|nr:glutamine synthetase III [Silvanigrellaceae bacterium]
MSLLNKEENKKISDYFACNVFHLNTMSKFMEPKDIEALAELINCGGKINASLADKVAKGVKGWALALGATHYCHWFQPQTGLTAEKHDAFLCLDQSGKAVEQFKGSDLMQSEPDASSFPSGGMRSTFEARGYTGWDPSSPMFVMETQSGKVLYIPSVFVSYNGEALDYKIPLLRSCEALSKIATRTLHLLGYKNITSVSSFVGAEQEFFVIEKNDAMRRLDLKFCGRTIFGRKAPKCQELEDHYFARIPSRVQSFIHEVEQELYKLGVPLKTRHNEVAPRQFEVAPIYELSNIAADHNQLLMEKLKSIALKYDFVVLFHEKPFAGVNGSGKHVNWSLGDSQGRNLLEPGLTPQDNLVFLTFLCAILQGVYDNADVLRASISSAGNDHRLGANEAPPAIISVFLGHYLDSVLNSLEEGSRNTIDPQKIMLDVGVSLLQFVAKDNTDRNRTSPFAFTGNKFEFRAVGSSASISYPVTILNAAVADGL